MANSEASTTKPPDRLLLVEGRDDIGFMHALIQHMKHMEGTNLRIEPYGGTSELRGV